MCSAEHPEGRDPATVPESLVQDEKMISDRGQSGKSRTGASVPEIPSELERDLVQIFKLLSDETRLRILFFLGREGEYHVTALCQKLGHSQPAVSHHLALLRVSGLIEARRSGKHNFYSVRRPFFNRIMQALFASISDPDRDEIRFDDFVLTQES